MPEGIPELFLRSEKSLKDDLATAMEELQSCRDNLAAVEAELWAAKADVVECDKARKADAAALEAAKREATDAKTDLKRVQSELERLQLGSSTGPIQLLSINWGGKSYMDNAAVRDHIHHLIEFNEEFHVITPLFGDDPLRGVVKWFFVVYRFTGPEQNGRIRTFVGQWKQKYRFDKLGSD